MESGVHQFIVSPFVDGLVRIDGKDKHFPFNHKRKGMVKVDIG